MKARCWKLWMEMRRDASHGLDYFWNWIIYGKVHHTKIDLLHEEIMFNVYIKQKKKLSHDDYINNVDSSFLICSVLKFVKSDESNFQRDGYHTLSHTFILQTMILVSVTLAIVKAARGDEEDIWTHENASLTQTSRKTELYPQCSAARRHFSLCAEEAHAEFHPIRETDENQCVCKTLRA